MLGLYVSDHPLIGAEARCARRSTARSLDLERSRTAPQRTVGGVITGLQRKWTKKGDLMAVFTLEDLQVDRGDGVPQDDGRHRPQAGRRRRGDLAGPGRQA